MNGSVINLHLDCSFQDEINMALDGHLPGNIVNYLGWFEYPYLFWGSLGEPLTDAQSLKLLAPATPEHLSVACLSSCHNWTYSRGSEILP